MQGSQQNPTELDGYDEYAKEGPERVPAFARRKHKGESMLDMMLRLGHLGGETVNAAIREAKK